MDLLDYMVSRSRTSKMRQEKCRHSEEKALSAFFLCCMHRWPSEMRYTYLHFQKHVEWWPLEGTWAQSYKMMRQVNTVQWFRSLLFRLLLWCLEGEPNMYPQLLFKLDHVTQSCACSRCRSWKSSEQISDMIRASPCYKTWCDSASSFCYF